MSQKTTRPKTTLDPKSQEFQQFSKNLIALYETGYLDKKTAYKQTFIKGILGGLGGVIGATVMVAILLWVLSLFNEIPLIGQVTNSIQHSIQADSTK